MESNMMRRNLSKLMIAALAVSGASGCFGSSEEENGAPAPGNAGVDPKQVLMATMDAHLAHLVKGINKVIIEGDLVREIAQDSPPHPIVSENEEEIRKAIDYLLANGVSNQAGTEVTYTPDTRICGEIIAKENPAPCADVFGRMTLVQYVTSASEGAVELRYGQIKPASLSYQGDRIDALVDLGELRAFAQEVETVLVQHGGTGFEGGLPTSLSGIIRASIAKTGVESVSASLSVDQKIAIDGTGDSGPVRIDIEAAREVLKVDLDWAASYGALSLNLPSASASFRTKDNLDGLRDVAVQFPGLTGALALENANKSLSAVAVKLLGGIRIDVDGLQALGVTASELNAGLSVSQGQFTLGASSQFDINADLAGAPGVMEGQGTLSASIAAGTKATPIADGMQMKIEAGNVKIEGTGSFNGLMEATAGSCIQGTDSGMFLESAQCLQ